MERSCLSTDGLNATENGDSDKLQRAQQYGALVSVY